MLGCCGQHFNDRHDFRLECLIRCFLQHALQGLSRRVAHVSANVEMVYPVFGVPVAWRMGRNRLREGEKSGHHPAVKALWRGGRCLLSLPRTVGTDPVHGEEVTVQTGRYGPYVKKGTESRSLEREDQLFTITLDEALALLAQPKGRRAAAAPKPPLRELGPDPSTGDPVVLREGRYGPYVTDGTTNASLRASDEADSITIERAAELLEDRRQRGPSPPKRAGGRKRAGKSTKKAGSATAKKPVTDEYFGTKLQAPVRRLVPWPLMDGRTGLANWSLERRLFGAEPSLHLPELVPRAVDFLVALHHCRVVVFAAILLGPKWSVGHAADVQLFVADEEEFTPPGGA